MADITTNSFCPGLPVVTGHQGNVYNTIQIGSQCWTRENMRCTASLWNFPNTDATNSSLFSALPAGYYGGGLTNAVSYAYF